MPRTLEGEELSQDQCATGVLVLKFTASWCGPCRRIHPDFETLAKASSDDAIFATVDVDVESKLCDKANVSSLPTFLFLLDGQEHFRVEGADLSKLQEMTAKIIAHAAKTRQQSDNDVTSK